MPVNPLSPVTARDLAARHCVPAAPIATAPERAGALAALGGWSILGEELRRTFAFADFHATMAFVNAVAAVANAEDHHPELIVGYNRCEVRWSTHDAGGLTMNDFICAARVQDLLPLTL